MSHQHSSMISFAKAIISQQSSLLIDRPMILLKKWKRKKVIIELDVTCDSYLLKSKYDHPSKAIQDSLFKYITRKHESSLKLINSVLDTKRDKQILIRCINLNPMLLIHFEYLKQERNVIEPILFGKVLHTKLSYSIVSDLLFKKDSYVFRDRNFIIKLINNQGLLDCIWRKKIKEIINNYMGEELQKDRELTSYILTYNIEINYISKYYSNDRHLIMTAVNSNVHYLGDASIEIRKDREVILLAMRKSMDALFYCENSDLIKEMITKDGMNINFLPPKYRNNRELLLLAIKQRPQIISTLTKTDREIVVELLQNDGLMLRHVSNEYKNDLKL